MDVTMKRKQEDPFKKSLEAMKKELRELILGKFMIRQDKKFAGLDAKGIHTYRIYFDTPTTPNKAAIKRAIEEHGFECNQDRPSVIGGEYGYTFIFRNRKA